MNKNTEELFERLEAIRRQTAREEEIKAKMLDILDTIEFEEDDIPQNSDFGAKIKILMKDERNIFSAVQELELDYEKIGEYICFKADDNASGTEDIYFISPTEVLSLESGSLSVF